MTKSIRLPIESQCQTSVIAFGSFTGAVSQALNNYWTNNPVSDTRWQETLQ